MSLRGWSSSMSAAATVALAALSLVALSGCADEPPLPAYQGKGVCFPVALQPDPGGRYLYVAGANFDRSFRGGVTRVFDTKSNSYLPKTIEIGSFASSMMLQPRPTSDALAGHRLLVASRDDDAVTAIDVERESNGAPILGCGGEVKDSCPERCSDKTTFGGDGVDDMDIGKDPVAMSLAANPVGTGHLLHVVGTSDGKVAIVGLEDEDDGSLTARAIDTTQHFPGIAAAVTSPLTGRTYISNNNVATLANYSVLSAPTDSAAGGDGSAAPAHEVKTHVSVTLPTAGGGEHGRGMALSSDSGRLYLAYRNPNALVIVDIAPGVTGEPANTLLGVVALGGSPAQVAVAPTGPGGRDLVYVSCFGSDDVWVVDPQLRQVRGVARLPHAPYALAVVSDGAGGHALYVSLFSQHVLARVPLINGLPPASDSSGWLELFKTEDCRTEATPEQVRACN